jgi:2-hydroxychromene-2-carboxylate isomerase
MAALEFWFDFSSPYSYLASSWIGKVAAQHGRTVDWQPTLLGAAFKATGMAPLVDIPLKGDYSRHDFVRSARFLGVPYVTPTPFPISTVHAARALLWLKRADPARVEPFVHAVFRAYFADNRNISELPVFEAVVREAGLDAAPVLAAIQAPEIKDALKRQVDAGLARGIFGAPFVFIDGEPFWGNDRRPQIERWLASGPF